MSSLIQKAVWATLVALLLVTPAPAEANQFKMEFRNTRIDDILRTLADRFDANVTVSGAISDSVSVRLDGLDLEQSLDAILYGTNWIWQKDGEVIRVISASTSTTQVFPLKYTNATDLAASLELLADGLLLSAESHSNSIIVTGPIPRVQELAWMIRSVDKYRDQVRIRADIVEITLANDDIRGVDLTALFNGTDVDGSFTSGFSTGTEETNLSLQTVTGDFDIRGLLAAINQTRDAVLLSSPEISTLDNQPAKILVGERVPYQQATTETETGATLAEVEFIDVGVLLEVTPSISNDDQLYLTMHTEVSEVLDQAVQNVPRIGTREADTRVMINHGDTVVIAGLIKKNTTEVVKRVPVLGHIPLLGFFFKQTDLKEIQTELVIFITPEVVKDPGQLRPNARQDGIRTQYLGDR